MLPLTHIGCTITAVKALEKGLSIKQIDYRVLIVASLLPDLVDKPLAGFFAGSYQYESRAFGHSLAFVGCLALLFALQWLWNRSMFFFPVVLGVLLHDVLDVMWLHPGIFYWPLQGWQFPPPTDEAFKGTIQLFGYKIRELDFFDNISVLLLLFFFMQTALRGKILDFFRKGNL